MPKYGCNLSKVQIHSTIEDVGKKLCISSEIVESALHRAVNTSVDWSMYTNLETIGIDEIAVKKGHNDYLTIVSIKDKLGKLSVIAVLPDKFKERDWTSNCINL